ncbi:hypothetical protein GON03_19025 [Nocardioides sp. MAH-18]|uniref:Uncharacterized protein n=1 Tax=Nocardioides agri TaxID=2682843 RepID=A0A6L6XVR2_9ACTN|nr:MULTISPECIES: hypothetical protein [unclassified Nocardioides]MBA2952110.1 hypothetical protein [Nocardioides sp. CGMCC 1.13656]MVQ51279.1 hypothetical protein [Nocardioides sp. MAH-18]
MPKSLADGHIKLAILTTAPANAAAPTIAELNAGINAAARVLSSDFQWSPTDSDKVAEKALADINNVNALAASNFQAGMTIFRFFNASTGVADPTEDSLFTATKVKGTTLWIYARKTGKLETAAWASGDEIYLGGSVLTDLPQEPSDMGGYIKKRIPLEPQQMYPNIAAA